MTNESSPVCLPDELLGMLHLARASFLYYETETRTWDEQSLIRFRDVLYDLVGSLEATAPTTQQRYIGAAMEHLALAISEPLQRRTEDLLAEIKQPVRLLKVFRLTHRYSKDVTEANVADVTRRIEHHLAEGRAAKVGLTLTDAQRAYDSFLEAYKGAMFLKDALKSRKLKLPVALLLWVLSVVAAGVIGAIITQLL